MRDWVIPGLVGLVAAGALWMAARRRYRQTEAAIAAPGVVAAGRPGADRPGRRRAHRRAGGARGRARRLGHLRWLSEAKQTDGSRWFGAFRLASLAQRPGLGRTPVVERGSEATETKRAGHVSLAAVAEALPYIVATDGACQGNPGPAGWAWVAEDGHWAAGSVPQGTNNIGELLGLLRAITDHPDVENLVVQADSMYAINTYRTWMDGHRRRGWKTSTGQPTKNRTCSRS